MATPDKPLAEIRKALKAAKAETKHERQARIQAEEALMAVQEELFATRSELEKNSLGQVRRTSFVVRLTLNQKGECGRMEVEHVETNKNQNFSGLDGEGLVAFMKATMNRAITQNTIPPQPIHEVEASSTPSLEKVITPQIALDIQVFASGYPHFTSLILCQAEPFIVQTHFHLPISTMLSLATLRPFCEVRLYANQVNDGRCELLITHRAALNQNDLDYTIPIKVPGLLQGLYDLSTVVIFHGETKLAVHCDGPMIQVTK